MLRFTEVSGSGSDNRVIANHNFASLTDRLADVVFAYEVRRFLHGRRGNAG